MWARTGALAAARRTASTSLDLAKADIAKADIARAETARAETARAETARVEAARTETAKTDGAGGDPATTRPAEPEVAHAEVASAATDPANADFERPTVADDRGNPAHVLGGLLDMPGSLRLEALLEKPEPADASSRDPEEFQEQEARVAGLRLDLAGRIERIREAGDKLFDQAANGPTRLPAPADLAAQLEALRNARVPALRGTAEQWAGSLHANLGAGIARLRTEALYARRQLARDLPPLGPRAARIEELDRVLVSATRMGSEALFARIAPSLAHDFGQALPLAVRAFDRARRNEPERDPEALALEIAEAWCSPEGWIGLHLTRLRQWIEAVTEHEVRGLEDLVDAAVATEPLRNGLDEPTRAE